MGIDEFDAINLQASGVGNDDLRCTARHFNGTAQIARVGGIDLVDDDARFAFDQPRVGLHPTGGLGLHIGRAVVEYGTLVLHIKLAVVIAADAFGVGRADVDLRQAIGCAGDGGALARRCMGVSNNLSPHGRRKNAQQGQTHSWNTTGAGVFALSDRHF